MVVFLVPHFTSRPNTPFMMSTTTTNSSVTIPVLDLSNQLSSFSSDYENSNSKNVEVMYNQQQEQVLAQQLVHALRTIGFVTLTNHGIDTASALRASEQFFALDTRTKLQYPYQGHDSNRGYIPMGKECHDKNVDTSTADTKETFELDDRLASVWPQELHNTSFQSTLLDYYDQCNTLQLKLLRWIAIGLKLQDANYFVNRCNQRHCNLRLLHYPSLTVSLPLAEDATNTHATDTTSLGMKQDRVVIRGARHTDFGTLTLLAQDSVGGLRVQPRRCHNNNNNNHQIDVDNDDGWISVPPMPGALVLNVGDMLQRWTNDILQATPHQVVSIVEDAASSSSSDGQTVLLPERYSVAFFCNANPDTILEPIMLQDSGVSLHNKYEHITAKEYLTQRLAATISASTSKEAE